MWAWHGSYTGYKQLHESKQNLPSGFMPYHKEAHKW
jgi:hypothetical protein